MNDYNEAFVLFLPSVSGKRRESGDGKIKISWKRRNKAFEVLFLLFVSFVGNLI